MNLRKSSDARNAACDAVVDMIDDGTSLAYGTLKILTYDSTVITSLQLSVPAFGDASDGTAIANTIYDNTAFIDGTAALFDFYNRDATWVWGGDVTLPGGGGVMELSSLGMPKDTTVSISSARYMVP